MHSSLIFDRSLNLKEEAYEEEVKGKRKRKRKTQIPAAARQCVA